MHINQMQYFIVYNQVMLVCGDKEILHLLWQQFKGLFAAQNVGACVKFCYQ
jgi:hypothetical protein